MHRRVRFQIKLISMHIYTLEENLWSKVYTNTPLRL